MIASATITGGHAELPRRWLAGVMTAVICLSPAAVQAAEHRFDLDESYDISPDGTIELRTRDADVTIVGSDRDDVHVEVHYERKVTGVAVANMGEFRVDVTRRGGDLVIEESPPASFSLGFSIVRTRYDVLIEAPQTVSLELRGDDDDYHVSDIHGAVSIEADDGTLRLRNCRGSDFDLALQDGELEMDQGSGSLRLRMDDGDAHIRNAAFERIDVRGNDGTLALSGHLAADGRYAFEFDDADLDLEIGQGRGEFSVSLGDGTVNLEGGGGSIEVSIDDGRASLQNGTFERLRFTANDGTFDFDGRVPPAADYDIALDDGTVWFRVRDGEGGSIETRFDDGRVMADGSLRPISRSEHAASYQWGDGEARISVRVNDGTVNLSTP